ncbi:MAG: pantetheine-phosphate adenylyltransferase [Deferribacterales bacterium]
MKRAVYPGTFDPMTMGHLDILKRSSMLFDEVILAVAKSEKKSTLFSVEERTDMARTATQDIKNIRVVPFSCLLVNFMQRMDSQIVIRGLRAVSDYEYELQLALMNRKLDPKLDTVFLMPSQQFIFLSSSMVREIASLGGDVSKFVPPVVYEKMVKKLGYPPENPCEAQN